MIKPFRTLLLFICLILWGQGAWAKDAQDMPDEAEAFIQQLADDTLATLDDPYMTQEERDQKFHDLLSAGFEIPYLSELVLGRHRKKATDRQLKEFEALFPDYIIGIYSKRLKEYGDERFSVHGTTPTGKRDIFVHSEVTRKSGSPFKADWRVRLMDDKLRIIDIVVGGISMLQTQREEFSSRIARVGFDGLLDDLRRKTGNSDAP